MTKAAKIVGSVLASFIFLAPININSSQAQQKTIGDTSATAELAFWNQIKDSGDVSKLKEYLSKYPNGMFSDLALAKYKASGGNPADLQTVRSAEPIKHAGSAVTKKKSVTTAVVRIRKAKHVRMHSSRHGVGHNAVHKSKRHFVKRKHRPLVKRQTPTSSITFGNSGHASNGGGGSSGGGGWGH